MVYQIICNTKKDFPAKGENFAVGNLVFKVQSAKVSYHAKRLNVYFVNVHVER